jgi:phage recombination protein Bet
MQYPYPLTDEDKKFICETVFEPRMPEGGSIPADALRTFFHNVQRTGLDPFARQIYLLQTSRKDNIWQTIVGIDGCRLLADRTEKYAGSSLPSFQEDDKGNPISCSMTVYKLIDGQKCEFSALAYWSEYFPGERKGYMWLKMPHTMLAKTSEMIALRKAFPADLSGLYIQEEMEQAMDYVPQPKSDTEAAMPSTSKPSSPQPVPSQTSSDAIEKPILEEGNVYEGRIQKFIEKKGKTPARITIDYQGFLYPLGTFHAPEGVTWEDVEKNLGKLCHFTVLVKESKGVTYTNLDQLVFIEASDPALTKIWNEASKIAEQIAFIEQVSPSIILNKFGYLKVQEIESVEDGEDTLGELKALLEEVQKNGETKGGDTEQPKEDLFPSEGTAEEPDW